MQYISLTWKSPKDDANEYSKVMVVNCMSEYNALKASFNTNDKYIAPITHMYLKQLKLVTSAALPSFSTSITQLMSGVRLVNGAATDASASERERPTSAAFKAAQSFAPSPHMRTVKPRDCSRSTTSFFSSGDIRAKTCALTSIFEQRQAKELNT